MCGFSGYWDFKQRYRHDELNRIVTAMSDEIVFRGPNSAGTWVDEGAGLAMSHRRLSVIDLSSAGDQPMCSISGRSVLAYNGEIYNADEIRTLLAKAGIQCRGHSDSEVLLEACELWGVESALAKLNGMFAFAFWDKKTGKLTLARDRLGIKPLYFGIQNNILYFASQLKALMVHPDFQPAINRDALTSYFRFNYIPSPLSIYKNIQKLRPGCLVVIDREQQTNQHAYWSLQQYAKPNADDTVDHLNQFEELLQDAVKCRLRSDVPLGAFLSGGIDSSTVVALMQAQSTRPVKTFSIGFNEKEYNEAHYAKAVAAHLGTEHHELYLPVNEAANIIPQLPEWYDEPFADSSQIPTYLVSKLAREHVTVSLSGDGGDELLAGYNRYLLGDQFYARLKQIPMPLRRLLGKSIRRFPPAFWNALARGIPSRFRPRHAGTKAHKLSNLLLSSPADIYQSLVSIWDAPESLLADARELPVWPSVNKDLSFVEQMQFTDTLTYLPDDILTKVDRASMAVSLEARVPLLDHRVVEFAWQLPMHCKLRGKETKWLLRRLLEKHVPTSLFSRPKMGFGVPVGDWLRGSLRDWAEDLLSERKLKGYLDLNVDLIRQRWQEHLAGTQNWQYSLWSVLMLQSWCERYPYV